MLRNVAFFCGATVDWMSSLSLGSTSWYMSHFLLCSLKTWNSLKWTSSYLWFLVIRAFRTWCGLFPSGNSLSIGIRGSTSSVRVGSLSRSMYFYIWHGIEALVFSYYWSHDAGLEKMTTSVFTFAIVLDAMLADSRAEKDGEYWSDLVMKGLARVIRECFGLKKKYRYISD